MISFSRGLAAATALCGLAAPLAAPALPLISEVYYDAVGTDDIGCVLFTGTGRAFNVGQDLGEFGHPGQAEEDRGLRGLMRAMGTSQPRPSGPASRLLLQ